MRLEIAYALIMGISTIALFAVGIEKRVKGTASMQATPVVKRQRAVSRILELSAQSEKESTSPNEPNLLTLSVRNGTRTVLYLEETYPERDYKFDVINQKGESVPLTKAAKNMLSNDAVYRHGSVRIKPGREYRHRVDINGMYEMTAPGTYFITVRRKVLGPDGKLFAEVTSNTVIVLITN